MFRSHIPARHQSHGLGVSKTVILGAVEQIKCAHGKRQIAGRHESHPRGQIALNFSLLSIRAESNED
jgi:hypothetical protein